MGQVVERQPVEAADGVDGAGDGLALAAELPASVLADLTGISVGTAERRSQWAKRDWAAYVGQRTADDRRGIGSQKLTNPTR